MELTSNDLSIMALFECYDELDVNQITRYSKIDKSDCYKHCKKLEKLNLILKIDIKPCKYVKNEL